MGSVRGIKPWFLHFFDSAMYNLHVSDAHKEALTYVQSTCYLCAQRTVDINVKIWNHRLQRKQHIGHECRHEHPVHAVRLLKIQTSAHYIGSRIIPIAYSIITAKNETI